MLDEKAVPYRYREYTKEPLQQSEIREILRALGIPARELLRTRDAAWAQLGLTGDEPEDVLIRAMAEHPTLIQRPIGRLAGRAVLGRPPERLLELVA